MMDRGLGHVVIYTARALMLEFMPFVYSNRGSGSGYFYSLSLPLLDLSILLLHPLFFCCQLLGLSLFCPPFALTFHVSAARFLLTPFPLRYAFQQLRNHNLFIPLSCGASDTKLTPISSPWYLLYCVVNTRNTCCAILKSV